MVNIVRLLFVQRGAAALAQLIKPAVDEIIMAVQLEVCKTIPEMCKFLFYPVC